MPRLSDEQRARLDRVNEVHQRIRQSFEGRQFTSQHCRFCNWSSNGRTFEEAMDANRQHEATHTEQVEYDSTHLAVSEIVASLHDHDCQMALCTCKCGCTQGPFCIILFGPLCSVCLVRSNRGYPECGEKQEAQNEPRDG